MVLLTVTSAIKAAIEKLSNSEQDADSKSDEEFNTKLERWKGAAPGSPIDHADLIQISRRLVVGSRANGKAESAREWCMDSLLKGAIVYQEPPPSKPEPTPEYKALMKRLRAEEEQRQYERMINPVPSTDILGQRASTMAYAFHPAISIGQAEGADQVDEVTYADVNRQMALIINVLVSIIACSVAIWVAARRWDVPQRLGLSMSGSGLVAIAEVAIYMGYIRRIQEAKVKERKQVETKEIVESWVLDSSKSGSKSSANANVRYRKGKHR